MAPVTKKMLNVCIYDILREYSDYDHRLTQGEIIRLLRQNYDIDCERKAVSRNITALMEYGYDIVNDGGYYLASRDFDDSEIRLLIDSVFFSPHIAPAQARALIEKLKSQAGPGFGRALNHVTNLAALHSRYNKQFFYTLQTLDDAIGQKRKVSFMVNHYGADKQLHPRREQPYIVNPYQIVSVNGRYYLVGNHDRHDNVAHIRIDRITGCTMLEQTAKPMPLVQGLEQGLQLPQYIAEHLYMRVGPSETVTFRVREQDIGEVIDWFGQDVHIQKEAQPQSLTVTAKINRHAMIHWALQYLDIVEVLEPADLRADILRALEAGAQKYRTP